MKTANMPRVLLFVYVILSAAPLFGDESGEAPIRTQSGIVNVHEHIQSVAEAERMVAVMDEFGIGKTILVGSPRFTITLRESDGFTHTDHNNEVLMHAVMRFPGRFEAWPTIDPLDSQKLEKLKELHARGASGVKLYLGHGFVKKSDGEYMFHTVSMDNTTMRPLYAYCDENFIPICFHVNPGPSKPGFAMEFVEVLNAYPNLKIICPHFMLSSINQERLRELLSVFPNLYSDISFGHDDFLIEGLERISENTDKFRKLFVDYPGRFMWGSDLVLTNHPRKNEQWIRIRYKAYFDMLTKETYNTELIPGRQLNGLALDPVLVDRILTRNYLEFSESRPTGTTIARPIEWSRMGVDGTPAVIGVSTTKPSE